MAEIVIDLGSVTVADNLEGSGKMTQQDFKDWLDNQFDSDGAGSDYVPRMRKALRLIGIHGAQRRAAAYVNRQNRLAVGVVPSDIINEEE